MSRYEGTLERLDLGAGVWVLRTADGEQLQLDGTVPEELEGRAVVVEGRTADLQGFAMFGPTTVTVATIRPG